MKIEVHCRILFEPGLRGSRNSQASPAVGAISSCNRVYRIHRYRDYRYCRCRKDIGIISMPVNATVQSRQARTWKKKRKKRSHSNNFNIILLKLENFLTDSLLLLFVNVLKGEMTEK
jgi:hypothetical protein